MSSEIGLNCGRNRRLVMASFSTGGVVMAEIDFERPFQRLVAVVVTGFLLTRVIGEI